VARAMVEKQFEKTYLSEALERYEGNVSKTAKETGINPRTLWRKIKKHQLERSMFIASKAK
jgi:DNA-binding NtrC family response regulator